MKLPLRVSVVLRVAAVNVLVFGAGLVWLRGFAREERRVQEAEYSVLVGDLFDDVLDTRGVLKASGILLWSSWNQFDDAVIVHVARQGTGESEPRGVFLNPLGSSHRSLEFDQESILADIRRAVETGASLTTERGIAVPVRDPNGDVWGGCWVLPKLTLTTGTLFRRLVPWFFVSTLLLTLGTFSALRVLVLDPVRQLAGVAARMAQGDLSVRVPEPDRHDEVSELVRSFNSMAAEVQGFSARLEREVELATEQARVAESAAMTQRRLAATGELAAGIAHEINNPLGGMLNALEVLQREDLPPEKREQYNQLLKSGIERIRETVGRVLRLAPRKAVTELVSLATPIGDALGLVRHRAEELGIEIRLRRGARDRRAGEEGALALFADLPPVLGEANELGQAVLNLLVNAMDAFEDAPVRARGRIEISLAQEGDELHLAVEDDGPGMDEALFERAPDLFFTTKATGKGTGLGLAIVHNVVHAHGGRVILSNEPGRGFRADIFLPVAQGRGEDAP
ncbi:MAG: HAMP domain-containing histidine kinase [Planctomycetota bacterium]|nr:MAG: HAMP domain-containing histidine kinase [Planctomycetota bacterium]